MYYGLSLRSTCKLAYEYALAMQIKMPKAWKRNKIAGVEWLRAFRKRHTDLSLRRPVPTSIARATAFNPYNVQRFFANFLNVMDRHKYEAHQIFNMDETGFSTVPNSHAKVISIKGVRTVGAIASAERGSMMTMALAVAASGRVIPPFFIFPRARMQPHFLHLAPVLSDGAANPSGWMKAGEFLKFLHHFQKHVQANVNNPAVLLLDNHDSHLSYAALEFCEENSICVVSFPPHCTHKLQPLDRTIFGPLKAKYYQHCETYLRTNPHDPITMLVIPKLVASAMDVAVTASNVRAGSECTGIYPTNPDKFTEIDFAPADVSDRDSYGYAAQTPAPEVEIPPEIVNEVYHPDEPLDDINFSIDGESIEVGSNIEVTSVDTPEPADCFETLKQIAPFPKAKPRIQSNRGRKTRKTAILTDAAVMAELRSEQDASANKKQKVIERKKIASEKKLMKMANILAKKMSSSAKVSPADKPKAGTSGAKTVRRGRPKKVKSPTPSSTSSDTDNETKACCVCNGPMGREKWKGCPKCAKIAHKKCGIQGNLFVCKDCDSDMDIDTEKSDSEDDLE